MGLLARLVVALAANDTGVVVKLSSLICEEYSTYLRNNAAVAQSLKEDIKVIVTEIATWNECSEVVAVICDTELANDAGGVLSEVVLLSSEVAKAKICTYYRINQLVWSGTSLPTLKARVPTILKEEGVKLSVKGILRLRKAEPIELGDIKFHSRVRYRSVAAAVIKAIIG